MSGKRGATRRTAASAVGWLLTAAGVVLFPLPGPGLLLLAVGLALLAEQHDWAARRVDRVRLRALRGAAGGVRTRRRAAATTVTTAALGASGLLWVWGPPAPTWWVLPDWTWLPGGVWSGIGQIVSGVIALALVGYSYRRFHGRPDAVAALDEELERLTARGLDQGDSRCQV